MINKIFLFILLFNLSFANDPLITQKQNTLYINNLIKIEEKIVLNFEKFLLTEFRIPTMNDLVSDEYLGSNFSLSNRMGNNLDFKNALELKLKYALRKDEFTKPQDYITLLYNRDLYRDYTAVYSELTENKTKIDISKSYVEFRLKSPEAKTIYKILKAEDVIEKSCSSDLVNKYCNNDKNSIRWYNSSSNWIEYNKKEFNNGNITISKESIINNSEEKLRELRVGSFIFIKDKTKNIKLADNWNSSTNSYELNILKVD